MRHVAVNEMARTNEGFSVEERACGAISCIRVIMGGAQPHAAPPRLNCRDELDRGGEHGDLGRGEQGEGFAVVLITISTAADFNAIATAGEREPKRVL